MSVPRIVVGLQLVDDEGDEVVVDEIDSDRATVTLLTSDDDGYEMSIRELRSKLRDGHFALLVEVSPDGERGEPDSEDDE